MKILYNLKNKFMSKAKGPDGQPIETETMRMLMARKEQICRDIAYAPTADAIIADANRLKAINDAIDIVSADLDFIRQHERSTE